MLKENKKRFGICNIDTLHNQGITGKGVKIAIFDSKFNTQSEGAKKIYNNKVIGVNGFDNDDISSHASAVVHIIHQICPDSNIYCMTGTTDNLLWCIDNNIDIINVSMKMFKRIGFEEASNLAVDSRMWLFTSSGNYGEEKDIGLPAGYETWVSVGAVHLYKDEYIKRASYSSYTKENLNIWEMVEIMGFSGIDVMTPKYPNIDKYGEYYSFPFNGTSGSSPFIAGMAGLCRQIFGKADLSQFRQFLYGNAMDLEEEGYDRKTGYGLFVLPKSRNISIIDMWIDNPIFEIDKIKIVNDLAPKIIDDRTFVPIRWVSENLGYDVGWDEKEYKVTIKTSQDKVILFIGRDDYYINGMKYHMDTHPRIIQDRTLVPIRFIIEAFGLDIFWYDKERKVRIIKW